MPQFPTGYTRLASTYLQEQLTKFDQTLYTLDYSEMWGLDPSLNFHKAVGDLPLGLEQIRLFAKGVTSGQAEEYSGEGDDIKVIEVEMGQGSIVRTAMFARAINWSWIELERQKTADALGMQIPSMNIFSEKQSLLGEFFNRREHNMALYGLQERGLYGILSQRTSAITEASFKPYFPFGNVGYVKPKQLYTDFVELVYNMRDRMRLTSVKGLDIKVPPMLHRRLIEMYADDANQESGFTVKQMLLDSNIGLGINSINEHNELQGRELNKNVFNEAGTGFLPANMDRIVFKASNYNPQRNFFARKVFPTFQVNSMKWESVAISATTGVYLKDPTKMAYLDFTNAIA